MSTNYTQTMGKPYPLGVSRQNDTINIALSIACKVECGIIFKIKNKNDIKIPFVDEFRVGSLYTIAINHVTEDVTYQLYADGENIRDPYGKCVFEDREWGYYSKNKRAVSYGIYHKEFDWEGDRPLQIPFHESVLYSLHVRGFTKHASSKVKEKGKFGGIVEKIPYLKELGITGIVCMPFYGFDEILVNPNYKEPSKEIKPFLPKDKETWEYKINYWGFSKGHYFSPQNAFASKDAVMECKNMIKQLHANGIECIMQMYFDEKIPMFYIMEVLKFWVIEYHVDGFYFMGRYIKTSILHEEPILQNTKLIGESVEEDYFTNLPNECIFTKNMAVLNDQFKNKTRKFLKSDEDMLYDIAMLFTRGNTKFSYVNNITSYQGFTLNDLYTYDKKHNELNGENNQDGTDYNYSWNCGVEGVSRKKSVLDLRMKQIRNAFVFTLLSQGTPMLVAGDEFLNTTGGNNNPYCQDNVITWLNWNLCKKNESMLTLVKELITFRKKHPILHKEDPLRLMDYLSCGYPDVSFHGKEAWRQRFPNYDRHVAVMYCGTYAKTNRREADCFIFIAFNMHWDNQEFALPKLPKGQKWYSFYDTNNIGFMDEAELVLQKEDEKLILQGRSIQILLGK